MKLHRWIFAVPTLLLAGVAVPLVGQVDTPLKKPRLSSLDPNIVNYIRPGVKVKIVSAAIAQDGTITARVNLTDPKGVPLDKDGINSPGAISMSFICAYIPNGQREYVSYTTTVLKATLDLSKPSQTQAANDSGGVITRNGVDGDYTYTFKTKAPSGFDPSATHTVGVSVNRNLTEFMSYDEWSEVANDTFNFVPNGSAVKTVRSVVSTQACNQCHNPLIGHGGSRLTVELCILCHTPQTVNPDTGLTQDMPVLIHKIHMGQNLPSVKAGVPYRIWHRGAWSDFSDVGFPSGVDELKTCEVCHQNAPQASNYMTTPTRAACGACHDDVNFASGLNHVNLPQASDNQCAQCHIAKGAEFDASVKGAHTVATRSTQLPGVIATLVRVDNAKPGQKPSVVFSLKNKAGDAVDVSKMSSCSLVMAGPTADYNGYVSESAKTATSSGASFYTYTFSTLLPANASGTYAVGIEGYNNVTINAGTVNATAVRDLIANQVLYFGINGAKATPRRTVVTQAQCMTCHNTLLVHGGNRQSVEYCTVCHNPPTTDSSMRKAGDVAESVNFKTMIHKIHTGKDLTTDYTVMGHGSVPVNFNEVGYPGDLRSCVSCHVAGTYNLPLPDGLLNQVSPRDYMTQMQPIAAACLSCHTTKSAAAHAAIETSPTLGESCEACHGPNAETSVDKVHAH
jgi:OmcA/MtrC family decaheme c-type cytochrome